MEPARVFISYAQESEEHSARVRDLANRLRRSGFDAWIDQFSPPPIDGWPRWMERQFERATWKIFVCTETYQRRFDQREEAGKGRGVIWEAGLVRGALYQDASVGQHFIAVTFSPADVEYIPGVLAAGTHHCLDREAGYLDLERHLRQEAAHTPAPIGESDASPSNVRELPVQSRGASFEAAPHPTPAAGDAPRPTKRVLIVAANRAEDERLALGREVREIAAALRGASQTRFEVQILWAATGRDFRAAFLAYDPHILHFCGHGTTGGPILEQTQRGDEAAAGRELQTWLRFAMEGKQLELAVLNFCDSNEMLDSMASTATIVIGPVRQIIDDHAITFSSVFYTALAHEGSGSFAYHVARSAVEMTPVESEQTRDLVRAPRPPKPGGYGIRCADDKEIPTFGGPRDAAGTKAFAFFASEPEVLPRRYVDQQLRAILALSPPPTLRIEQRWATRPLDFVQTLMVTCPAIVHVTGHGDGDGAFRFEDDRYRQGVSAERHALGRTLAAFYQHVECAVLMFDYSSAIADDLDDVLDHVIAVRGDVPVPVMLQFSELFYQMTWHRRPYQVAFGAARLLAPPEHAAAFVLRGRKSRGDGRVAV